MKRNKSAVSQEKGIFPESTLGAVPQFMRVCDAVQPISWRWLAVVVGSLLCCASAMGANWFVLPSAAGAGTGRDWNNAWSMSGISWASVAAGDTIYIAGGSYSGFT